MIHLKLILRNMQTSKYVVIDCDCSLYKLCFLTV